LNLFLFNNANLNSKNSIKYSLSFVSLITPQNINNIHFLWNKTSLEHSSQTKKIYLKQSYVILTWFYYLTFFSSLKKIKLKIVSLPLKKTSFTLNKSPMAHKTFSKEQFKFQYYNFKFIFSNCIPFENEIQDINHANLFLILTKSNFPKLETNIFFLKNFKISFFFSMSSFLQLK
jgi:hypothetical protein